MREVVILGVGMTKFGISTLSMKEMFSLAALEALGESRVEPRDLEALFAGNVLGEFEESQMNIAPFLAAELGMPTTAPLLGSRAPAHRQPWRSDTQPSW